VKNTIKYLHQLPTHWYGVGIHLPAALYRSGLISDILLNIDG